MSGFVDPVSLTGDRWVALEPLSREHVPEITAAAADGELGRLWFTAAPALEAVEQWVDNFKRDLNPDRELDIWEAIAKAYTAYCSKRTLSPEAKREVYKVVLLRSMAPESDVLERLELKVLTKDDAVAVMQGF